MLPPCRWNRLPRTSSASAASSRVSHGQCGAVQAEEERLAARRDAIDPVDRAARDQVGEIAVFAVRLFARPEVVPAARIAVGEVVDAARHRPEERLVARAQRTERGRIAEVPLADQRGPVAGRAQQRRQGRMLGRQTERRAAAAPAVDRLLGGAAQPVLVARRHQREPGRRADRRVRIALRHPQAAGGEAVEHRRDRLAAAVAAEVGEAEVVGDDEDDVRAAAHRWAPAPEAPATLGTDDPPQRGATPRCCGR